MVKSIIKEIIIILLLLLAVILALGVLFYDYIPNNKTVPSVSTYKTSSTVQNELDEKVTEAEPVLVTYEITSEDLQKLEKSNVYNKGKANPFSTYENKVVETEDKNNVAGDGSIGANVSGGNASSENTFYQNTGTK